MMNQESESKSAVFSREEAARYIGLGLRTLGRLLASGEVNAIHFPGRGRKARRVLITRAECDRYLAKLSERQEEKHNGDKAGAGGPRAGVAASGRRGGNRS